MGSTWWSIAILSHHEWIEMLKIKGDRKKKEIKNNLDDQDFPIYHQTANIFTHQPVAKKKEGKKDPKQLAWHHHLSKGGNHYPSHSARCLHPCNANLPLHACQSDRQTGMYIRWAGRCRYRQTVCDSYHFGWKGPWHLLQYSHHIPWIPRQKLWLWHDGPQNQTTQGK